MAIAVFGPGILILTRTDIAIPIAINVGFVQEYSLDLSGTTKSLYGQKQYPLVTARGTIKATGKFKSAEVSGLAWNAFFYGQSAFTSGAKAWSIDSTFTMSTAAGVQVGSSLSFDTDLGVWYSTKGLPLQRVSTGLEAQGKYSIGSTAPGLYFFSTADAALGAKITYVSSGTTNTAAQTLDVTNQLIGTTPTFQLDYYTNLNQPSAKPFSVRVYACVADKQMLPFKLEDFMIPEFEFGFFGDANDRVISYYFPDIS